MPSHGQTLKTCNWKKPVIKHHIIPLSMQPFSTLHNSGLQTPWWSLLLKSSCCWKTRAQFSACQPVATALTYNTMGFNALFWTPRATILLCPTLPSIHIVKKKNKTIYKKIKIAGMFQLLSDFVLRVQSIAHDSHFVVTEGQRATAPQVLAYAIRHSKEH